MVEVKELVGGGIDLEHINSCGLRDNHEIAMNSD